MIGYHQSQSVFWLCSFTATELSSYIASFETTGNLESWDGSGFVVVWFLLLFFSGLSIIRILSRCCRIIAKISVKMDTEIQDIGRAVSRDHIVGSSLELIVDEVTSIFEVNRCPRRFLLMVAGSSQDKLFLTQHGGHSPGGVLPI